MTMPAAPSRTATSPPARCRGEHLGLLDKLPGAPQLGGDVPADEHSVHAAHHVGVEDLQLSVEGALS